MRKTQQEVIDPIREIAIKAKGDFRQIWLRTPAHGASLYCLSLPFAGHSIEAIKLAKTQDAFTVSVYDNWDTSIRFEYDEEYLTIREWTVRNGMFLMVMEHCVPERYSKILRIEPVSTELFDSKYGNVV